MDRMLGAVGLGARKTGEVEMLRERVKEMPVSGDHLAAADVPSGVLVGVSPVNVPVPDEGAKSGAQNFGLLHVLVVDDDEAVRKACCQIASGMGFAVVLGAESATAAREILKHQRIDVLLLDFEMPDIDGLHILSELASRGDTTPVIMVSGKEDEAIAQECMASGACDYISKPVNFEYLQTSVWAKILMSVKT